MDNKTFERLLFQFIDDEISSDDKRDLLDEIGNNPARKKIFENYTSLYHDGDSISRDISILNDPTPTLQNQSALNKTLSEVTVTPSIDSEKHLRNTLNQKVSSLHSDTPKANPQKSWQAIGDDTYLGRISAILILLFIIIIGYLIDRKWASNIQKNSENETRYSPQENTTNTHR